MGAEAGGLGELCARRRGALGRRADVGDLRGVELEARRGQEADSPRDAPPWDALVEWLGRFVEYVATKQALAEELFALPDHDADVFKRCRTSLFSAGEPLLMRAQEAGSVRPDVSIEEVVQMVGGIAKIQTADPAAIERILGVALDGLRYRDR